MQTTQRRPITRNRELHACKECRSRKLKCDRNLPCGSCVKRGDESSCTYQHFTRGVESDRERRQAAEARLEHLEGLVQQLAASQSAPSSHIDSGLSNKQRYAQNDAPPAARSRDDDFSYTGSTHWSAMLEDIEELRYTITPEDSNVGDNISGISDDDGVSFIFGASPSLPFEQILTQYLPARAETDRLVAAYFRANSVVAPFIHSSHFKRRYHNFWQSPQSAPPLWTSILFSVCHVASTTLTAQQQRTPFDSKYILASAQCLAIGKYYKPQEFAVEALLLFTQARCFQTLDVTSELGIIISSVIRVATTSGYHKDPDVFNLSPFEREMRRRTWSLCLQLDMLISFALGFPSDVQIWDSQVPRNLLDTDFDEDSVKLPQSRSDSDPTNISFYNAKHKLMAVFQKILHHALRPEIALSPSVEDLEIELTTTYLALPEVLRPRPMTESIVDSPSHIITRLCVLFTYQKCRCVLHRKYAVHGREESIQICYESSSSIVGYFQDIYQDLQPGGQLESERWFNSTLTWHDYLLGIMVLCLVLCVVGQGSSQVSINYVDSLSLLRRAQDICSQVSHKSRNTTRVQKLIDATLLRFASTDVRDARAIVSNGNVIPPASVSEAGMVDDNTLYPMQSTVVERGGDLWSTGWNGALPVSVDDASWAYLEQFLNIPNEDRLMDL